MHLECGLEYRTEGHESPVVQIGESVEVSWHDGGSWHQNLRDSDGLKPQPRKHADIADIAEAPDRVKEIYEIVLPHYQRLHAERLRVV